MPVNFSTRDPVAILNSLGVAMKSKRVGSEQFCVFAFDVNMNGNRVLVPCEDEVPRSALPFSDSDIVSSTPPNWNAAYYNEVAPLHTERAILANFEAWISAYSSTYGAPSDLYIYSFLIPCDRDGDRGGCADWIIAHIDNAMRFATQRLNVHIGFSNGDRDIDARIATLNRLADADEGKNYHIFLYRDGITIRS